MQPIPRLSRAMSTRVMPWEAVCGAFAANSWLSVKNRLQLTYEPEVGMRE